MAKTAPRKAPASQKKAVRAAPKKKSAVVAKKSPASTKRRRVAPVKKPLSEQQALPPGEPVVGRTLPFELDPKRLEEGLGKLRGELVHWTNKGRYTRVRFKFRGKQLLPDLPVAAVVAAEGLTFYWGGILRGLMLTVAGGSLLQVELVNDADKRVRAGKEALLAGDLDEALALFHEALAMDRDNVGAHLNVGVALKLKGEREGALASFERARALDPEGPLGAEAERLAAPLRPEDAMSTLKTRT